MTKKGNLSAALSRFEQRPALVQEAPPPEAEPVLPPNTGPAERQGGSRQPPSRAGKKALTGYFGPEVLKQLKIMAAADDTTIQALLTEALNDLFKKHGKPHIA